MRVMDELITKQSAVEAMRELFRYAYCDNCQYGGSRSDNCDGCHRKYNNWRASDLLLTWTIRDLPSAGGNWILCSEQLPEITFEGQRRGWYLTTNANGAVGVTGYEFYHDFMKTGWQSDTRIVAWMPLPDPWEGEGDD